MKIAILSGHFPPDYSGVGDHTVQFSNALIKKGHQVEVWTSQKSPAKGRCLAPVRTVRFPWDSAQFRQISDGLLAGNFDALFIQYTPQSIVAQRFGVSLSFPFRVLSLKARFKKPVYLLVHELNYPVEMTLRGILIGLSHVFQVLPLLITLNRIFFTTAPIRDRVEAKLKKFFLGGKMRSSVLPVGSNLEVEQESHAFKKKLGLTQEQLLLFHFGGSHPTHLYSYVFLSLQRVLEKLGKDSALLVCVGVDAHELSPLLEQPRFGRLRDHIRALGKLPGADVSQWFLACDLVLCPYMDGISTRRSSAMSAFQHGKPVVSTRGASTDPSIPWESFCLLSAADQSDEYVRLVEKASKEKLLREQLSSTGMQYYQREFSWDRVVDGFLSEISSK